MTRVLARRTPLTGVLPGLMALAVLHLGAGSAPAGFINGGFEIPRITPGVPDFAFLTSATLPGWQTTSPDGLMEIWSDGFLGVTSFEGFQHAELNGTTASTLFQEVVIPAGELFGWEFAHRARVGTDVMRFTITDLGLDGVLGGGDDTVLFSELFSATTAAWVFHSSSEASPLVGLGNNVRFAYEAVSTGSGSLTVGNFIDAAAFGVGAGGGGVIPEPSACALAFVGGLALGLRQWRRRRSSSPR